MHARDRSSTTTPTGMSDMAWASGAALNSAGVTVLTLASVLCRQAGERRRVARLYSRHASVSMHACRAGEHQGLQAANVRVHTCALSITATSS